MLTNSAVRKVSRAIAGAVDRTVQALREGRIEQEANVTDRMLGSIEEVLRGFEARGIRWSAKTLTDRGRGTQEKQVGADFMGVLDIRLPDFNLTKGFLAQAKLLRPGRWLDPVEVKAQCEKMLDHSAAAYVFLYGSDCVRVIPATSVLGADGDLSHLHSDSVQRFFEDHLRCFIGDPGINAPTPEALRELAERMQARSAMLIQARSAWLR